LFLESGTCKHDVSWNNGHSLVIARRVATKFQHLGG